MVAPQLVKWEFPDRSEPWDRHTGAIGILRIKFVHPVRTQRWRIVTLPMAFAWVAVATVAAWMDFQQPAIVTWALIAASLYLMIAGALQQALYRERL